MIETLFSRAGGPDALREGYWLIGRGNGKRVDVPMRTWWGPPRDPDTGELLDRSLRWHIEIAGGPFDDGDEIVLGGFTVRHLTDFWPACCANEIDEAEYRFRLDRQEWAALNDPDDPYGSPGSRINPMTVSLPFMEAS